MDNSELLYGTKSVKIQDNSSITYRFVGRLLVEQKTSLDKHHNQSTTSQNTERKRCQFTSSVKLTGNFDTEKMKLENDDLSK